MRVTHIELESNDVQFLSGALGKPGYTDKFWVKAIIGLDAEEIIPRFYGFSGDGEEARHYDFGLKPRSVVIRAQLNPNFALGESYSDIRDGLYRAISSQRSGLVSINFLEGGSTVALLRGKIVKFEVPLFSKIPEVQLTLECDDPLLRAVGPVQLVESELHSPLQADEVWITDSLSTAPHGLRITTTCNASLGSWVVRCPDNRWKFEVIYSFQAGDVVEMSSEPNAKTLTVTRSAVTTSILDAISTDSDWPKVFPGLNKYYWLNRSSWLNKAVEFTPAYWGV